MLGSGGIILSGKLFSLWNYSGLYMVWTLLSSPLDPRSKIHSMYDDKGVSGHAGSAHALQVKARRLCAYLFT